MSKNDISEAEPVSDTLENSQSLSQSLGRYRILNEVGRGATAFVYKAYDPQLDRFLAIKVLRPQLALDEEYRDAFIREARLAAQLTHPGIVTIFDVGIADNKPYIGMELLEGATLEQILANQGKLNLKTVLAMTFQLSKALSYAHKRGVVHRDIKPGNIVVLKDKKTIKLTDFGIAQLDDNLTNKGQSANKVMGTPEYMSPEQVLGETMDDRSDLYSLGVLIYRMLMGLPPFVADDLSDLFKQIVKNKPPELHISEDKVQDDLQDLIRKLLQKNPEKRFMNALSLTAELRSIQGKIADKTQPHSKEYVSLKLKWSAVMAGVVFTSMCIGLVVVYFMQFKALSGITFDYGRSIAQSVAYKSSESLLLDDTVGLNALVNDASHNEQLKSVILMDNDNSILAATNHDLVGKNFTPPPDRELMRTLDKTDIFQRQLDDETVLFDIAMPIVYAEKKLGFLYISFSADLMYSASRMTLVTMLVVMMLTLIVVFIITLSLAKRTSNDYQRVTQALNKMALGRIDARLVTERNDEAGLLFSAFNRLANYLEHRFENSDVQRTRTIKQAKIRRQIKPDNQIAETVELDIVSHKDESY